MVNPYHITGFEAMKTLLFATATCCLSLGVLPAAWANDLRSTSPVLPTEPSSVESVESPSPEFIQPAGTAADLLLSEPTAIDPLAGRDEHLDTQAERINQTLAPESDEPETPLSSLVEAFQLPRGMVIRGTQRGGLAIGSELQ